MPSAVEFPTYFDLKTGCWLSLRIWRSRTASNARLACAIFSDSGTDLLEASRSNGILDRSIGPDLRGGMSILPDNQFGLQRAGLFHRLENCHHVPRRHAECVQGRSDFFDGRQ